MAIQSGLFFTSKGAKYTTDLLNTELNANANFIQLPVHFAYKIDVMPGTRIVLHAGPYIAYGVGGKTEFDSSVGNVQVDTFEDEAFLDVLNGLKSFDAGLGLGIGAEFGRIILDLGWDMGLANLSRVNTYDVKTQNAYLSVGYRF